MEKLYNTQEIADMYGVSAHTVTTNWCNKGLKFIRSNHYFLFKLEWVESFLEKLGEENANQRNVKQANIRINKTIKPRAKTKFNYSEMKIV